MNNGDRIRQCNNEELCIVMNNLENNAIYGDNRLLYKDDPKDFLVWLNKETDQTDLNTIFKFD